MKYKIITIFPEFFRNSLNFSLIKKAVEKKVIEVEIYDLRKWAKPRNVHRQVDDRPFGGGPGMVMMIEPMYRAIKEIQNQDLKSIGQSKTVIFSPKGETYTQVHAESFSSTIEELILICPHYEGFDDRILNFIDYEFSIGDYVLTGGEIPALILIDSISRLIPGVVGNDESVKSESFSNLKKGLRNLEHAQYTRPVIFTDNEGGEHAVPKVLLSGNHNEIEKWRSGF